MGNTILSMIETIIRTVSNWFWTFVEPYWEWYATGLIITVSYRFLLMPILGYGAGSDSVREGINQATQPKSRYKGTGIGFTSSRRK